jgi:hypothetical protein
MPRREERFLNRKFLNYARASINLLTILNPREKAGKDLYFSNVKGSILMGS